MAKKYGLKCFRCGNKFNSKEEVTRIDGMPYCGICMADISDGEYSLFLEEEWARNNPGREHEEVLREEAYLRKYGEY